MQWYWTVHAVYLTTVIILYLVNKIRPNCAFGYGGHLFEFVTGVGVMLFILDCGRSIFVPRNVCIFPLFRTIESWLIVNIWIQWHTQRNAYLFLKEFHLGQLVDVVLNLLIHVNSIGTQLLPPIQIICRSFFSKWANLHTEPCLDTCVSRPNLTKAPTINLDWRE
jgi:hypothetical protein